MVTADRVLETSTSTGTGDFTLDGAVTGYQTFNLGISVGNTCEYSIEAVDANGVPTGEWEVGEGTLSGATTLQRTTVLDSSNGGAAVNFSAGTKNVFVTQASDLLPVTTASANSIQGNPTNATDDIIAMTVTDFTLDPSPDLGDFVIGYGVGGLLRRYQLDSLPVADISGSSLVGNAGVGAAQPAALQSGDITTNASPANGDFLVSYTAAGLLRKIDWADLPSGGGGGTPGGTDRQVQFNDSGSFGGTTAVWTAAGALSSPGVGSNSEHFGAGSSAAGTSGTSFGANSAAQQSSSSAFGRTADAAAQRGTAVGADTTVNFTATYGSAFGWIATVNGGHTASIALGYNSSTTRAQQLMVGGSTVASHIDFMLVASAAGVIWEAESATHACVNFRGAVSQTADLTQWQASDGTPIADVAANGDFTARLFSCPDIVSDPADGEVYFYRKATHAFAKATTGAGAQLTPHNAAGEWVHNSWNDKKERLYIRMEALIKHLAQIHPELAQYIEES